MLWDICLDVELLGPRGGIFETLITTTKMPSTSSPSGLCQYVLLRLHFLCSHQHWIVASSSFFLFFFSFLQLHLQPKDVPRPGVELELQL